MYMSVCVPISVPICTLPPKARGRGFPGVAARRKAGLSEARRSGGGQGVMEPNTIEVECYYRRGLNNYQPGKPVACN